MHKHRKFRHGPRHFHGWGPFHGAIWWIGLAILFSSGDWWPGILILMGLSMAFGSLFGEEKPRERQERHEPPPSYHIPVSPPPAPRVDLTPVNHFHRADSLPVTCPHCGGPIRSYEVKWTGAQTAACPYCGSNLKMK